MKNTIIALVVIIVAVGAYFYMRSPESPMDAPTVPETTTDTTAKTDTPKTGETTAQKKTGQSVIGVSVEGRDINAYRYGSGGATEILFIGGIHGGYEWNTSLVAFQAMDYFEKNPSAIPANVTVTVIPVLNPDGLFKVVGKVGRFAASDVPASEDVQISGRFNAHTVDLNRNFDCDWQSSAKWQNKTVSGGSAVFSEPESQAIKAYVENNKPGAVVVWYSATGGVFASSCHNGVSAETNTLTQKFATASGYPAHQSFDFYATTGDMVNWLAKSNVPAISVLLTNHTDTEWSKNQAGIEALLKYYTK